MRTLPLRSIPRDDDRCGWLHDAPAPPPVRRWSGAEAADVAVVGAGFTGLAAARRLAELEPGWRIVLLDAQHAGDGASGRSSGFVVERAGFVAAMAPVHGERFMDLSRHGIAELRRRVAGDGIDCDWDDRGWLHVAAGDAGEASLRRLTGWLRRQHADHEELDAAALERLCGSPYYRSGVRLPGSVLVHTGKLVRGLAASLPSPVELYQESPVLRLHESAAGAEGWRLETPGGTVIAPRVIVAVNGALPALGIWPRRLFPLYTFGSLTRPLTEAEQGEVGEEREWGLLAQDVMGSSLRRTRDQRLMIRNSVHYRRNLSGVPSWVTQEAGAAHRKALADRYPALAEVPFDSTWSGLMGMSGDLRHAFGPVEGLDGVWAAGGYHGAGIALGTTAGLTLAEAVTGRSSAQRQAMEALPGPRWIPPEPFLGLGVRTRLAWDAAKAGESI
jgi:glycine/D-amino acid oxidase-like deaminating enzyme